MSGFLCRIWIGGLVLLLAPPLTHAQGQQVAEPAGEKLALADLVDLAIQNTQIIGSLDARMEQKRFAASQARVWPGSSLDFSIGRRRESAVSGPRYELGFAQPLPLLGKPGLRGSLFDLESQSWQVRRAAAQIAVTLNVVQLAYEYAANRRKADFVEKRQKRFELIQEYLAGRVFPTPQRKAESRIVRHRVKGLVADAIQSQAGFKVSFEKLKVYVPLRPVEYPDIDAPWLSGAKTIDEREWLARALENNPDLRVQRIAVRGADVEKTLASREGLPDPSLAASYEEGRAAETEKNFGLGLSLALPSWNSNRAGIKSAQARRLAEERLLGFEEQKLKAEIPRLLVEYEAARQIVQKHPQDMLRELEAQLKETEEGFRKGQVDLLTFLELDSTASETYGRVLDAQRDLAAKIAELLATVGEQDALSQLGAF